MRAVLPFLLITIVLAAILSIFASSQPDGLERLAGDLGFANKATEKPILTAPLPDYTVPRLGSSKVSTSLAGLIGVFICFFLPFGFYLWRKK